MQFPLYRLSEIEYHSLTLSQQGCYYALHQICEFHVKAEFNKAVLKAVAQVRSELAQTKTKLRRGRPSTQEEKAAVRRNERIQAKITALFDHRFLFVQKELSDEERKTFLEITKGLLELRKLGFSAISISAPRKSSPF